MGMLYACSATVVEKKNCGGTVYRQVPSFVINAEVHAANQSHAAGQKVELDKATIENIVKRIVNPTDSPAIEVHPNVVAWRDIDHPHSQPLG